MSDATPSLVADRYRLDERISSGPMGEVWRGYDTRADWVVAVKVLGARVAGATTREVLRQHAQAVARVIHPNVAMVLDVGDQDGAPFLVMEFLTGPSLGEELAARGPLPIVEVCDLIGQAAAGLDAAHRAGVVHGHVAPHSFRLAGSGVLKVVGFGMGDRVPGDPRYVAPERAAGQQAAAAGDLYALGCVCYELLCGRPPFGDEAQDDSGGASGQGAAAAPSASGRGAAAAPSASRAEVPVELDRLVLAMIAEDPAKRPGSGEAIRRALAAIARPRATPVPGATQPGATQPGTAPAGSPPPGSPPPGSPPPGSPPPGSPPPGAAMPVTGVSLRDGGVPGGGSGGAPGGPGGAPGAGTFGGDGSTEVFQVAGPGGAPPRAGDTAVYQAGDLEPGTAPNRKLILQLGAAVVVIAVVTVVMVMWAGARKEEPLTASTPTAEPTTEPTTLPSTATLPTEEPTPDPTPGLVSTLGPTSLRETAQPKATLGEAIPPGGWRKWLSEFDEALAAQQAMGGIDPKIAGKARDKIRKAAEKFGEGRVEAGMDQVAGVYHDLRRAQEKGGMDGSGPAAQVLKDWRLPDD
ncbi:serine/threonine-protein kinase [Nonomuraea angiospora]|uniref:serine/threonine-protein kinase n=1 Tax=Nonomuraea angiospora TaxID=46172 RepID=UPI0034132A70